ncbi:outer dynein arm-docking complex subunit 1 isoform X1 [Hyla sarda]|uniref:outer dynein arm-docking complex subunit 1 isoform X1 n=2 Tax=Hyla sarda TaxID=327740 RepID=UPI0024C24A1D|nr:outer dynein arm-docking complex subunit 1 isoform X1 [Hyla sarda]XP_056398288.1 outer dynein arm-docking complex subunit 1 isoform X1 [Hyla sarda]XP_056398289.1 outer dynein arm-docking complex subunit 1 isoform X1 [Hyla sarda]XP_056398290.1 outer dynein arm-docking complex subunit 1 isoform X1 [Hyla sarda]XP_056398291.1 outer dynein arm-docking complex subunit 1 isoform X1 [Hyla sarda]XP_056398292.1 outer dynein arm-docking complex subunit 1 isoform X1 [Hyla sarda]XP_056398293.1 outer dy
MPNRRPASSIRSDNSDMDLEGMADSELAKLQRMFRLKEGQRQATTIGKQEQIRRQQAEMSALERERDELLKDLRISESRRNQSRDQDHQEKLHILLEQKDELDEQLIYEKQTIADLDQEIKSWEKKIYNQRKQVRGSSGSAKQNTQTQKNIKVMENRLDRSLTKFNLQLAKNSKMREEIDILRIERSRFDQLYKRLEKELLQTRKESGSVIDESSAAYDARDEAQTKMLQMRERAEKDLNQHTAEIKELQRVIDHDRRLKEFMGTKTQERSISEEVLDARRRREKEEQERKKRDPTEDTIETYEQAFQQIQSVTGEDNLDILVNRFIEVEDRNFALFNYVNEQNNEIERLTEQITEIKREIEEFKAQGVRLEQEHRSILKNIEGKQEEAVKQADGYQQQLKGVMKILDQLKSGIDSLFKKINCDRSVLDEMLGSSSSIREANIMQYLGLIEQKTNELLAAQSFLDSKNYDKPYDPQQTARVLLGQLVDLHPPVLEIQPPGTGDEYDSDSDSPTADEEERPLTQAELRERIMKGVLKKEVKARKKGFPSESSLTKMTTKK